MAAALGLTAAQELQRPTSQELQRGRASDTMAGSEIPATSVPGPDSTPIENEGLFKLVERSCRKRNAKSKSTAATSANHSTLQNASARVSALHGGFPSKPGPVWKLKPLPRLHREYIVIILTPRVTVALKDVYQHGELGAAFAAYLGPQAAASLSLLPTWEQNLIVAGTRNPHVADKLLRDFQLDSSKGQLLIHGHNSLARCAAASSPYPTTRPLSLSKTRSSGVLECLPISANLAIQRCGADLPALWATGRTHAPSRTTTNVACVAIRCRPPTECMKSPHECTPSCAFRQLKLPGHKAKRPKPRTTRRPKKPRSHPTPEDNGGAPRFHHHHQGSSEKADAPNAFFCVFSSRASGPGTWARVPLFLLITLGHATEDSFDGCDRGLVLENHRI
ncbi:hypothetical protein HPB49_022632 [Dermacentor silvarum]|uniref:Uncharacterized protein n=1 Tax=Dermacentor silvarum TaxID=543639 RepID=A0ACB8C5Q1_DERSI|nr:hypothetical protein HPB49_022632 [Dermacentor silvarum]